jgi:uncharacterized membrane protein YgcG
MRLLDWFGIGLVAAGSSLFLLGHHWSGPTWLLIGASLMVVGMAIVVNGVRVRRFERNLRSRRGQGDYGSTDYHSGKSASDSFESSGSDGGGGGGD